MALYSYSNVIPSQDLNKEYQSEQSARKEKRAHIVIWDSESNDGTAENGGKTQSTLTSPPSLPTSLVNLSTPPPLAPTQAKSQMSENDDESLSIITFYHQTIFHLQILGNGRLVNPVSVTSVKLNGRIISTGLIPPEIQNSKIITIQHEPEVSESQIPNFVRTKIFSCLSVFLRSFFPYSTGFSSSKTSPLVIDIKENELQQESA